MAQIEQEINGEIDLTLADDGLDEDDLDLTEFDDIETLEDDISRMDLSDISTITKLTLKK
jgi:hypothetical protein